jgi:hypothetical protein
MTTPVIVNGTLESINLYNYNQVDLVNGKYIANHGEIPHNIPAGNVELGARITTANPLDIDVPFQIVGDIVFGNYDSIPIGDLIIVTQQYKNAVRALGGDTTKLAIPWQPVLGTANYGDNFGSSTLTVKGYLALATG